MKKLCLLLALTICAFTNETRVVAQTPGGAPATSTSVNPNRVIGEVTAIDAATKQVSVKTDLGTSVTVSLDEKSEYLRTRPGATNLDGATKIALSEIHIGDRVLARGRVAEDQKSVATRQLIVMTKADLAEKHEREREEWRRRGVVGTVSALNPETKEITLQVRALGDAPAITLAAGGSNVKFRRYAPDSVRFIDAVPGTLSEIKVGDQIRAKGEKSADGTRFAAEEIVSGTFRSLRGTVVSVDPPASEIKVKDAVSQQTVTVTISKDSTVRRIPADFAQMMATRGGRRGGRATGEATDGAPRTAGGEGGRRRPEGASGAEMGNRGRMGGGPDVQEMLERMPAITVNELKPGEMVVISSTLGADPTRVTAMALVAGVEALMQREQRRDGTPGASLGLPGGALDIGIGLP